MNNDLYNALLSFGDILAFTRYEGIDTSSYDYGDMGAAIGRAKAEVKAEIGLLLLELLAPEKEKKRAGLRLV